MSGKNVAIVLAAGQGKRMNSRVQKQFLEIDHYPVLYYSLRTFQNSAIIDEIIVVTGKESVEYCLEKIVKKYAFSKVSQVVAGGKERYDSVYAGLLACAECAYVFIHDGARPFLTEEMIVRGFEDVVKSDACVIGMPSKDTVKLINEDGFVTETPERSKVWIVQTPQIFKYSLIKEAHDKIRTQDMSTVTDDAMVVERVCGVKVKMVEGSYYNLKITTPEDLIIAEQLLCDMKKRKSAF